jgi:hypothetical protein
VLAVAGSIIDYRQTIAGPNGRFTRQPEDGPAKRLTLSITVRASSVSG